MGARVEVRPGDPDGLCSITFYSASTGRPVQLVWASDEVGLDLWLFTYYGRRWGAVQGPETLQEVEARLDSQLTAHGPHRESNLNSDP